MNDLTLRLANGTLLVVPASLAAISTYALLEQETWFEKEIRFLPHLLEPGWTTVDIGANLGVYSLAMAALVGPGGTVFAYEPTSATRARLERSRDLNAAANLEISGRALSDGVRRGRIVFEGSSEANRLGCGGEGEAVEITALDAEWRQSGRPAPDFIKIDAEGEEEAIIRGAAGLLGSASPIVMMEIKAGSELNTGLVGTMADLGYSAYRLLSDTPLLVPLDVTEVDGFELNFFALKGDRATDLESRGLLVSRPARETVVTEEDVSEALAELRSQPFAAAFPPQFASNIEVHPAYLRALAAYHIWRANRHPLPQRFAALQYAVSTLIRLADREPTNARLATLARVAAEAGKRSLVAPALKRIIESMKPGPLELGEPFWPPASRYDSLDASNPVQWLLGAVVEQIELNTGHSTAFRAPTPMLPWLCGTTYAMAQMHRRLCLHALRRGQKPALPPQLCEEGPDNLNASLWRDGTITGLAPAAAV